MIIQKTLLRVFFLLCALQSLCALPLAEEFKYVGYLEIFDKTERTEMFDALYTYFDELIEFLQTNPLWAQKLYSAKERFIRSKERNNYSTNFFGFYDESKRVGRGQISFYYSSHFHEFLYSHYPEFNQILPIRRFFEACLDIKKTYVHLFNEAAAELSIENIFSHSYGDIPTIIKVVKYLPSYVATRPHYDGTAFSLFLHSTDNQSLLLSPYKPSFTVNDFYSPLRNKNSILLIPGTLLTEFSIYPTPHIVVQKGHIRYATIAFAMRPDYTQPKNEFSSLPNFKPNFNY